MECLKRRDMNIGPVGSLLGLNWGQTPSIAKMERFRQWVVTRAVSVHFDKSVGAPCLWVLFTRLPGNRYTSRSTGKGWHTGTSPLDGDTMYPHGFHPVELFPDWGKPRKWGNRDPSDPLVAVEGERGKGCDPFKLNVFVIRNTLKRGFQVVGISFGAFKFPDL